MKKFLTFATLATFALTSCNNDNDVPVIVGADGPEIRFDAQALTAKTKAPFEGEISGSNELIARVVGSETSNNYGTLYTGGNMAKGDITFADQGITQCGFPAAVHWPSEGSKMLYFRGFYPGGTVWTISETEATATVDGKSDLMGTTEISGSSTSVKTVPLRFGFTHLLTKLHVKVVGTAAAATAWGTISKIELLKTQKTDPTETVTLNYAEGSAKCSSTTEGTIPFYRASVSAAESKEVTYTDESLSAISIPATPTLVAYSLVPPVIAVKGSGDETEDYTLKITTSKGEGVSGKAVTIDLLDTGLNQLVGDTYGKKFDITIQFSGVGEITASATVTDWVDGGEGNGEM